MQSILTVLVALAATTSLALQVTSPAEKSTLDLSKDNKITWASVSSDPSSFQIQLVNMAVNPPVTQTIADNVQTSSGSFDLKSVKGITPGNGYQVNLVSTSPQNSGILAQSGQFSVANAGASTTSASFSSSTPSGSSASSTTSSSTTSGSSSSSSSSGSSASTTGTDSSSASGSSSGSASSTPTDSSSGSSSGSSTASSSSTSGSATGNAAVRPAAVGAGAGLGFLGMVAAVLA